MKKIIFSLFVGAFIGSLVTCIILMSLHNIVDSSKTYGIAEIVYYYTQPIGTLGTFIAIIVAIFGVEIKNLFFSPKCEVSIHEDGFTENLGQTISLSSPRSQCYNCTMILKNTGSKELIDLQLVVKDVYYVGSNKKQKKISKVSESILYWNNKPEMKKINLREKETKEIIISRIYPEAIEGTPDNRKRSPLRFSLTGINLDSSYSKNGTWKVLYSIQTPHKIIKNVHVEFTWTGNWCDRMTEMANETDVKILKEEKL